MKINKIGTITFDEIESGQCFERDGMYYIKCYNFHDDMLNKDTRRLALNLRTGGLITDWNGSEECTLYENAEVKLI